VRTLGFDDRRRIEAIDLERHDAEDRPADIVRDMPGCRDVGDDPERSAVARHDPTGRHRQQLTDLIGAQPVADLGQRPVDRRFEAGEVAAMVAVEPQIERVVLDLVQRRLDLRR
jgi:hypothetical protein